jgi:hypothetical protein
MLDQAQVVAHDAVLVSSSLQAGRWLAGLTYIRRMRSWHARAPHAKHSSKHCAAAAGASFNTPLYCCHLLLLPEAMCIRQHIPAILPAHLLVVTLAVPAATSTLPT